MIERTQEAEDTVKRTLLTVKNVLSIAPNDADGRIVHDR
jgi:hypothetical protein